MFKLQHFYTINLSTDISSMHMVTVCMISLYIGLSSKIVCRSLSLSLYLHLQLQFLGLS